MSYIPELAFLLRRRKKNNYGYQLKFAEGCERAYKKTEESKSADSRTDADTRLGTRRQARSRRGLVRSRDARVSGRAGRGGCATPTAGGVGGGGGHSCRPALFDNIATLFGDTISGSHEMRRDMKRYDRSVNDAKVVRAVNEQLGVHDAAAGLGKHGARSERMILCAAVLLGVVAERVAGVRGAGCRLGDHEI